MLALPGRETPLPCLASGVLSCSAPHLLEVSGDCGSKRRMTKAASDSDCLLLRCTGGLEGVASEEAQDVRTELLVNVDQPGEAREWVHQWRSLQYREGVWGTARHGFVLVLFSHNVHENRAYNTLARLARGEVLVLVQDDDLAPYNCTWLPRVSSMAHHPRLAVAGTLGAVRLWGSKGVQAHERDKFGRDRATGEGATPAELVDVGPLAFRRSAWLTTGGSMSHGGLWDRLASSQTGSWSCVNGWQATG